MKSGSIFDNVLVTDDEKYAEEFGLETWGEMKDIEKAKKDAYDEQEKLKAQELSKKLEEEGKSYTFVCNTLVTQISRVGYTSSERT